MAVLIPNVTLTVNRRAHPAPRDSHGTPVLGAFTSTRGPYLGRVRESSPSWTIGLDPRAWPVEAGDEVTDGSRTWVLTGQPILHTLPGNSMADWISATGTLNPPETP